MALRVDIVLVREDKASHRQGTGEPRRALQRCQRLHSRFPVGRDDGERRKTHRADTPGPRTCGGAHRGMNSASLSNNAGEGGINRHPRMSSCSPASRRQEGLNWCSPSDDCSEQCTSDYCSFSCGCPAASGHSENSKSSADRSVVSHRSHRSPRSQHALPAKVMPIAISIAPEKHVGAPALTIPPRRSTP